MRDRADFERYVKQRSERLLRTAYLLCRDWATAEDLLQTALAKAWLAWRRVGENPDPYVYRILANTHASWWRRRWRGEQPAAVLPEPAIGDSADLLGSRDAVRQALTCLPPKQVFVWHEGALVDQGPCGIQDDHVDHLRSWTDQDGRLPAGRDDFLVAVVPAGSLVNGHGAVDADDATRIVGETGEYSTDARVTIREAFAVVGDRSAGACQGDIVIRRPDGREILSSACDQPSEKPPSPRG